MENEWTPEPDDVHDAPGEELPSGTGVVFDGAPAHGGAPGGTDGEDVAHRIAVDAVDRVLDEVELALARLDDGTYGRCERCGGPVDDALLTASPITRTCGGCDTAPSDPQPAFG